MIGSDWEAYGFRLHPLEPSTGPFPERPFLRTWWDHRTQPNDALLIASSNLGLIPFVENAGTVTLAGDGDVTDYHSPLGAGLPSLIEDLAAAVPTGVRFDFDSLPGRAASGLSDALLENGYAVEERSHAIAAVLELPATSEEHLASLSKKERHETRRKLRRFEAALGEPSVVRHKGADAVAMFAEMHRHSSGDKGAFMTDGMEAFFQGLHAHAGGVIDVLVTGDDTPAAAAFSFEDDNAYYLYNSAYEPAFRDSSPGVVLLTKLIDHTIDVGRQVFDFLKGDESYKFRLGARERPLCRLTGEFVRS